ncbi:MAG: protoporphyrinogen/coproporphyrinogen oxidase [Bacteroidota bacterium]
MNNPKLHILGGGPAGLATAYYAQQASWEYELFEARSKTGGNCRTLQMGPFGYDTGAHRLHDKAPQVTQLFRYLLGEDLQPVDAPSQIYHDGRTIDFPLTPLNIMRSLDPITLGRVMLDWGRERLRRSGNELPDDFAHQMRHRYGKTLADLFLINYTEKLWGVSSDLLSPEVSGNRLKHLSLRTFLLEWLRGPQQQAQHLDGHFLYPQRGIGQLMQAVTDQLHSDHIHTGQRISQVSHHGERLLSFSTEQGQRHEPEQLISTLPLTVLMKLLDPAPPAELLKALESIQFRHIRLVAIALNRPSFSPNASIYFPDRKFGFSRLYESKNRSAALAPFRQTCITLEYPCFAEDTAWKQSDEALIADTIQTLSTEGLLDPAEVMDAQAHRIPYAYPVLTHQAKATIQEARTWLDRFENLHLIGRSATFRYLHIHDLFAQAGDLVERLPLSSLSVTNCG